MPEFFDYFSELGPFELIGVGGFMCYLLAFGGVQLGVLDGNSTTYSLANITAAVMMSVSLVSQFNLPSALIQGSWIVIGLIGLTLRVKRASKPSQYGQTPALEAEKP